MKKLIPLALVSTCALSALTILAMAPASAQTESQTPQAAKQCVYNMNMHTQILDQNTILATNTGRGGIVLDVKGCRLHSSDTLVMEYRGSNQICGPSDVQISVRDSSSAMITPCFIQSVKAVTKEEAKALSSK